MQGSRLALACALVLGLAAAAGAQTPCTPIPDTIAAGSYTFALCAGPSNGTPINGVGIDLDGANLYTAAAVLVAGTTDQYLAGPVVLPAGSHTLGFKFRGSSTTGAVVWSAPWSKQVAITSASSSGDCATVTTTSGGSVVDALGIVWSFGSTAGPNNSRNVLTNPAQAGTAGVFGRTLTIYGGRLYLEGDDPTKIWYLFDASAQAFGPPPAPPPCGVPPPPLCTFTLTPSGVSAPAAGMDATATITASDPSCTWAATSDSTTWLSVLAPGLGTGSGTFAYRVAANTGTATRTGNLNAGGKVLTVAQVAPVVPPPDLCAGKLPVLTSDGTGYTNRLAIGETGRIGLYLTPAPGRRIVRAQADLIGDGNPGWTIDISSGAEVLGALRFSPLRSGSWNLKAYAWDDQGCQGETGATRTVTVRK